MNREKYTPQQINILLSMDHEWLKVGSQLCIAADKIIEEPPVSTLHPFIVGTRVGIFDEFRHYAVRDFERIASMLFAMAVEAWMKGLLIKQEGARIGKETDEEFADRLSASDPDDPESSGLYVEIWDSYFLRHKFLVKSHGNHDLLKLGEACGVCAHLDESGKSYLDVLGAAIERGRYTTSFSPSKMTAPDDDLSNVFEWRRIRQAVRKRFDELFPEGPRELQDCLDPEATPS